MKAGEFGPDRPLIKEWTTQPLKLAEVDDILICVVGATAGKLNRGASCAIGRSVAAIRPSAASSAGFIYPRLKSEVSRLRSSSTGTAQGVISKEMLSEVPILLPPAAEQRRIVAKLDALTARIARARAELDRVAALAAIMRTATLSAAFETEGIGQANLADLLEDVRYGTAQKCGYNGGKTPVLRIPNIQSGRVNLFDMKFADLEDRERSKLSLELGDVLVIRSNGSLDLVGRSAVVDESARGMSYAGYLIRLRPNLALLHPDYLHRFLSSPQTRGSLMSAARSTSGVNNVNAKQLQALNIPLRSLAEQAKIVAELDAAFARADRMEAEAARAKKLLDRLESAILAKAFRGELVPQDPDDEPASVLLERIRAERAGAPKPKRGRRKAAP